jgi:hypothetical protein
MKRNRIFIVVIILLIISNAFTIFLLLKEKKHGHHPPFLSEKIGLTGEKLVKVKKMEESHFEKMKPLTMKINLKQAELYSDLSNSNLPKQDSIKKEINQLELDRQNLLLQHFKSMYENCNTEEKKKLSEELKHHFSKHKNPN